MRTKEASQESRRARNEPGRCSCVSLAIACGLTSQLLVLATSAAHSTVALFQFYQRSCLAQANNAKLRGMQRCD